MAYSSIDSLLQHPALWRAGQLAGQHDAAGAPSGIATGYQQLDEHLLSRGWPTGGLMEFLLTSAGIGELRLLAPALAHLSRHQQRWITWVNPPFVPYAPALQAVGIDVSKILLIHPRSHEDTLWAMERAGRSGSCSCVLAWPDERKLKLKDTQRLQVAAKQGNTLTCLFRPDSAQAHSSMAELRMALRGSKPGEISLDILKRRGGWPVQDLVLHQPAAHSEAAEPATQAQIQEQLELWRAVQERKNTPAQTPTQEASEHVDADSVGMLPVSGFARPERSPGAQLH